MWVVTRPALRPVLLGDKDRDDDPSLEFRARRVVQLRDPPADGREELVLHLHRLERDDRRVALDDVALLYMDRLEQAGHRRAELDATTPRCRGAATRAQGALVDDARQHVVSVHVEPHRVVRDQRDLVTFAVERDRPLPRADDLSYVRGDRAVIDQEAAVLRDLDPRPPVVPAKSAESTRIPGPAGSRTRAMTPLAGRKPAAGSSAVMRHSIAAPRRTTSACANGSGSPAAMASCKATRSSPVTISVTGCST